jgi:sigma-B regulation protein RsbU (phosphoserine phosphatase)
MELAGDVQKLLIPQKLPSCDNYEFASIYKPHFGVGGDYFDFIEFPDGKIVFCVGDFTGKGLSAALLMANFQANFHTLINKQADLDEFIRDLNQSVNLITQGDRFITFFIAEYNTHTRNIRYVNAGHNPPILVSKDRLLPLNKGCIMLGSYATIPEIEIGECHIIEEEAIILAYTDGLTDIRNSAGDFVDEDLLYQFVRDNFLLGAEEFNERLLGILDAFRGEENYPDDFTVLTCKIHNR